MISGLPVGLLINCTCRIPVPNRLGLGIKEIGAVVPDRKLYSLK